MRLAFPVLVHGINKQVAQSSDSYRVTQEGAHAPDSICPREIDPEQTRLEVTPLAEPRRA